MEKSEINYSDWWQEARQYCRTQSAQHHPERDEKAHMFNCTLGEFLETNPYLVRFTDKAGDLVMWNNPEARPLTVEGVLSSEKYLQELLRDWPYDTKLSKYFVLNCSDCGKSIIIDGTHRIVKLSLEKQTEVPITVYELSGKWPSDTPDISKACDCRRKVNAVIMTTCGKNAV